MITRPKIKKVLIWIVAAAILLLGLVFGSVTIAGNTPARRADKYLDLGNKYLDELDYEQALVAYRQVLEIEPKNLAAYKGALQASEGLGDRDGMAEFYTNALGVIEGMTEKELKPVYDTAAEIYLYADTVYPEDHEAAAQALERGFDTLGGDERLIRALIAEYGILAGAYIDEGDYKKEQEIYRKILEKGLKNAEALSGWEQRVRERFQEYLDKNGGSGNALGAMTEPMPEYTPEPTPAPIPEQIQVTVKRTDIQADSVFNQDGYGCLTINGVGSLWENWDNPESVIPPQKALIDAAGNFVFPYKSTYLTYRISDGVVSLTESSPYSASDAYSWDEYLPAYYNLDGSSVFVSEVVITNRIDEYKADSFFWRGGPIQDGYALMIKEVREWLHTSSSFVGSTSSASYYSYIMDKSGTITCTLPNDFNEIISFGDRGFGTKYSLGWCGEGLFAVCGADNIFDEEGRRNPNYSWEAKGYMDPAGNMVLDLSGRGFINLWPFHEGLAAVRSESGMFGFIDKTGALVIPCIYEDVGTRFSEDGICAAKKDGKWGYIDRDGNVVIPFEYDNAYGAGDGMASVVKDGKCGLVDYSNSLIVPLEYDDISSSEGGTAYAIKEGVLYIIQRVTDF